MTDKLLPCPFCGGEASVGIDYLSYSDDNDYFFWRVICYKCEITGTKTDSERTAIEAWNKRPNTQSFEDVYFFVSSLSQEEREEFLKLVQKNIE
jgi:Lar family restriction alleviation protein